MRCTGVSTAGCCLQMSHVCQIQSRGRYSARTGVRNRLASLHMNRPSKMIPTTKTIQKRCEECQRMTYIPHIKLSRAQEYLFKFYPCVYCGHITGKVIYPTAKKIRQFADKEKHPPIGSRCYDCFIPFNANPHYALGRCKMCYTSCKAFPSRLPKSNTSN